MSIDKTPSLLDRLDACKRKVAENDALQDFDVEITEVLQRIVSVEASSVEEAEAIVRKNYKNADYILDADHFRGVEFNVLEPQKDRSNKLGGEAI